MNASSDHQIKRGQNMHRQKVHWLLFSGHRIDVPGRVAPRFPAESEPIAREMILAAIRAEVLRYPGQQFRGICSGANGGDILFLESCATLDIPTEIYLALEKKEFAGKSVADGGEGWMQRFDTLTTARPVHILPDDQRDDLHDDRRHDRSSELNIWQRTNLWMLDSALSHEGTNVTVIVLWDGNAADGPGGTIDMVERAQAIGARVVHLDATKLT